MSEVGIIALAVTEQRGMILEITHDELWCEQAVGIVEKDFYRLLEQVLEKDRHLI